MILLNVKMYKSTITSASVEEKQFDNNFNPKNTSILQVLLTDL